MNKKLKNILVMFLAIVVVSLVITAGSVKANDGNENLLDQIISMYLQIKLGNSMSQSGQAMLGTIGTLPIENYIPVIAQNDGYYSTKDITTTGTVTAADGSFSDDMTIADDTTISGNLTVGDQLNQTPGRITATTTLTSSSESIQLIDASANMITITLPAVTATGTFFRVQVAGALTGSAVLVDSAEGDNISGTLIVAGAVVDCRDEDQINIVTDGEAIGDYVELYSIGSSWVLVDSGVLTSAKMTCTDPS